MVCRAFLSTRLLPQCTGLLLALALTCPSNASRSGETAGTPAPRYESRQVHDRDGIGKFYFGREIAAVMGHQGGDWLERPERGQEEQPGRTV